MYFERLWGPVPTEIPDEGRETRKWARKWAFWEHGKAVGEGGSPANKQSGAGLSVTIIRLFKVKTSKSKVDTACCFQYYNHVKPFWE